MTDEPRLIAESVVQHPEQGPDREMDLLQAVWAILTETNGSEGFVRDLVNNSVRSWKANEIRRRTDER